MYRDQERYGRDPSVVVRAAPHTFRAPLRWHDPGYVFTCSWSDFFIDQADAWRDEAWAIIRQTPHLTYQILTKRPENIAARLPADWGAGWPNAWIGVSIESQAYAHRLDALCELPARLRFVSAEPLLGTVDLSPWLESLGWVIAGGESGPDARPMEMRWLQSIADQCDAAGVPLHVKQDFGARPGQRGRIPAELWARKEIPA